MTVNKTSLYKTIPWPDREVDRDTKLLGGACSIKQVGTILRRFTAPLGYRAGLQKVDQKTDRGPDVGTRGRALRAGIGDCDH